jgi:hypothetical protein
MSAMRVFVAVIAAPALKLSPATEAFGEGLRDSVWKNEKAI